MHVIACLLILHQFILTYLSETTKLRCCVCMFCGGAAVNTADLGIVIQQPDYHLLHSASNVERNLRNKSGTWPAISAVRVCAPRSIS